MKLVYIQKVQPIANKLCTNINYMHKPNHQARTSVFHTKVSDVNLKTSTRQMSDTVRHLS